MIKFFKIACIAGIYMLTLNTVQSQNAIDESASLERFELNFPPLQVVIDSVLKNSSMLNFRKNYMEAQESKIKIEQLSWTRNLGIQGDTRYGNLNSISSNTDGQINSSFLTTTQQLTYSAGLYLKLSVFDFMGRKNEVKLAKMELEEAKSMAEFQEEEIRQNVIKLYQNLLLKYKILQIKSKKYGDGKVNMEMTEKEFRNGVIDITEYVRISDITSNIESDYEIAKSEFITTKQVLEDMAGFVFNLTYIN